MTKDNLSKGVELWGKAAFVKSAIKFIDECAVLSAGSKRLDNYMDVHDRITKVVKDQLLVISSEIDKEIEKL